jgi:hypothetical protein
VISTLQHMNFFTRLTGLKLIGIVLLAVISCVVFPFFLVIIIVGMARDELCNFASQRYERRGRRHERSFQESNMHCF